MNPNQRINGVMALVADYYGVPVCEIAGKSRKVGVAHPRLVAMYLCADLLDYSLAQIAAAFGGRDHTTVMHARNKLIRLIDEGSAEVQEDLMNIMAAMEEMPDIKFRVSKCEKVMIQICKRFKVELDDIAGVMKEDGTRARRAPTANKALFMFVYVCVNHLNIALPPIARYLNVDTATVRYYYSHSLELMDDCEEFERHFSHMIRQLSRVKKSPKSRYDFERAGIHYNPYIEKQHMVGVSYG